MGKLSIKLRPESRYSFNVVNLGQKNKNIHKSFKQLFTGGSYLLMLALRIDVIDKQSLEFVGCIVSWTYADTKAINEIINNNIINM